ncbi:MAG: sterol carrier family protein [Propionibacteriaceae bacterium]|nr:sterol carrier family protein [Propionibacteriaceae bacterium]
MFSGDTKTVTELRDLLACLAAVNFREAVGLGLELDGQLAQKRPDLTGVLWEAARAAQEHGLALGRALTAACCRAFAARLGEQHPGGAIEVRVPPWTAVQVGFGEGPTHRRGTPPNVVEMAPEIFIALATGNLCWSETEVQTSGSQAEQVAAAFPLRP